MPTKEWRELTAQQRRFVIEFSEIPNAKRAAIKAHYSEQTAESQGCQLLKHPKVAHEIARRTADRVEAAELSRERLIRETYETAVEARTADKPDYRGAAMNYQLCAKLCGHLGIEQAVLQQILVLPSDKVRGRIEELLAQRDQVPELTAGESEGDAG